MGIITLRLNSKEEKILKSLQNYLDEDKSKILKNAMIEKYEELQDRETIELFEKREQKKEISFQSADGLVKKLEKKYKRAV